MHCVCVCMCVARWGGGYFYECVCMFVFIAAEERLCFGQNNLTSRCAEAWGKSIQAMAPKAGDDHTVIMQQGWREGLIFNSNLD